MADERSTTTRAGAAGGADGSGDTEPVAGCLVRLGWMVFGNLALLLIALSIAQLPRWTFGYRDLAFWATAAGIVGLRLLDVTRLGGRTVHGEPAGIGHVMRHGAGVAAFAAVLWLLAQLVAVG